MTTQSWMMVPNQCRLEHGPSLNSCGLAVSQGTEAYLHISVKKIEKCCQLCVLGEVTNISPFQKIKIEDDFLLC